MTLTIYGQSQSRAIRALWMAEELGIPYDHVPIEFARAKEDPTLLAINPNGRVPAIDDDGFRLFESMAINLYLAKRHGGELAPADLQEDALATQWSFWVMTEVEKPLLQGLFHKLGMFGAERSEELVVRAVSELDRPFAVLESRLANGEFLIADRFTVADLNVASVFSFAKMISMDLSRWPALARWVDASLARPALARARAR